MGIIWKYFQINIVTLCRKIKDKEGHTVATSYSLATKWVLANNIKPHDIGDQDIGAFKAMWIMWTLAWIKELA